MRYIKSFIYLFFLVALSCKTKDDSLINELDYDSDYIYYTLNITNSYDKRYSQNQDEDWKEHLLLKKEIFVKDSCFGGMKNMPNAIRYAKKIKVELPYDCVVKISIEVKTPEEVYKPVWIWKQNFYWPGQSSGEFGEFAGRIELDEIVFHYKGELRNGIKIIYKFNDIDGYTLSMLNFISTQDHWELVSREQIITVPKTLKYEKGYCIDSINDNCETKFLKGKIIDITKDMLFELPNRVCH